jgi:hypothetical protein
MHRSLVLFLCGCALLLGACSGGDTAGPTTTATTSSSSSSSGLPPVCTDGTVFSPGTKVFHEATSEWGLQGVEGVRLDAVDFDGDGWTDLMVRRGGSTADQFVDPPPCCPTNSCAEGTNCQPRQSWLLRNTGQGRFEDVTESSGALTARYGTDPKTGRPGSVWAFADVDNDGDLDLYTGLDDSKDAPQTETSEIMLNDGDGTFSLGPEASALRIETADVPAAGVFVDYDRDGLVDLWVPQNSYNSMPLQDRLYRGDGTGAFAEVTEAVGLKTKPWSSIDDLNQALAHTNGWSGLACDLDGDGNPELLSASYGRAPNHLWRATGPAGGFGYVNHSIASGYAFDQRTDWTDNESARCWCKLHPDAEDCEGVPPPEHIKCTVDADAFRWDHDFDREPFRLGGNSAATICGDVDNDGDMDLLTTEIVHWDVGKSSDPSELLMNSGSGDLVFERPGNETTGLTRVHDSLDWNDGDMTGALFDFDNDGWLDVYIGSSDYPGAIGLLFHNLTGDKFAPVSIEDGIDHHRSHGIAVADFDRDGDLDVAVGHSLARCGGAQDCYPTSQVRLFINDLGQGGNWVQLRLEGAAGTNRAAIGARASVSTADSVVRTAEVGGGHGHFGAQQDLVLHFGLGASCEADVTVRWPNGALDTQSFHVVSGYRYHVVQGQEPAAEVLEDAGR